MEPSNTDAPHSAAEVSAFVQQLVQQMQGRFQSMSDSILARMDDMGAKLDELEKSTA